MFGALGFNCNYQEFSQSADKKNCPKDGRKVKKNNSPKCLSFNISEKRTGLRIFNTKMKIEIIPTNINDNN